MLFFVDLPTGKAALEISSRTFKLLKSTLEFSVLSTVFATILAIVPGLFLCDRKYAGLRLPLAFLVFLPPYIHAQGFANLVAAPPRGLEFLRQADGIYWSALVCGLAFAPICSMVISTASFLVPAAQVESARINLDRWQFFRFTVFPAVLPLAIAGACITFIFSIMEGGLPLSMQTTVFATEIISQFLAGGSFTGIFISIWPMFALISIAFLFLVPTLKKLAGNIGANRRCSLVQAANLPPAVSFIGHALLMSALSVMFLPCLALVRQAFSEGNGIFSKADIDTILPSIGLSFFCALFCTLICRNISKDAGQSRIFTALLLISAVIPASLTGVAWAWAGTWVPALPQVLILGLSHIARALPLTMIVSIMAWKSFSGWRQLESANLLPQSTFLKLRIEAPVIFISFCVATVISLRELEATLLTVPAGYQTLPLRVFNLIHYGAGADVARLSLALALIMALAATALVRRWPK
jgi:iron(III) transport system permease protein